MEFGPIGYELEWAPSKYYSYQLWVIFTKLCLFQCAR